MRNFVMHAPESANRNDCRYSIALLKHNIRNKVLIWLFAGLMASIAEAGAQAGQPDPITARKLAIQKSLQEPPYILRLSSGLNAAQSAAQDIVLSDSAFANNAPISQMVNRPLREVFGVYPARQSDLPATIQYEAGRYYRIEIYNFALNSTNIVYADLKNNRSVHKVTFAAMQPDIPDHLKQLGLYLASNSAEVERALGFKPVAESALMAETKTALNNTRCERSMHLCVAPTFTYKDKALWVIVDLTEMKVAGIRWTYTGREEQQVTERSMQNKNLVECFCAKDTSATAGDWRFNYMLTSSDGLKISDVKYKNRQVIDQAKLVDWHVSYSNTEGFGYSDAVGCPVFSQSAVIAIEAPVIDTLFDNLGVITGFRLKQNYWSRGWPAPCNYQYEQRFEFYVDGAWRFAVASLGRGCGNNGTYRPVLRIVLTGEEQHLFEYDGHNNWNVLERETWLLQDELTEYTEHDYWCRITTVPGGKEGFYIVPGKGQFDDGGRGDFAYLYATLHHADRDEGDIDLPTIGPCCNTDHQQGPEKFMMPESEIISGKKVVLWYVPQIKNDDTPGKEYCWAENYLDEGIIKTRIFPCFAGPLFVPIK